MKIQITLPKSKCEKKTLFSKSRRYSGTTAGQGLFCHQGLEINNSPNAVDRRDKCGEVIINF